MASQSSTEPLTQSPASTASTTNNTSAAGSASTSSNGRAKSEEAASSSTSADDDKKDESIFECNICLDTAKDAVVSMCGHLFCWPCLHQWLETRPSRQLCPVCKAAISKEKVIPLYGRGSTNQEDPRLVKATEIYQIETDIVFI